MIAAASVPSITVATALPVASTPASGDTSSEAAKRYCCTAEAWTPNSDAERQSPMKLPCEMLNAQASAATQPSRALVTSTCRRP